MEWEADAIYLHWRVGVCVVCNNRGASHWRLQSAWDISKLTMASWQVGMRTDVAGADCVGFNTFLTSGVATVFGITAQGWHLLHCPCHS